MLDANTSQWVKSAAIADVILVLASPRSHATSGALFPGESWRMNMRAWNARRACWHRKQDMNRCVNLGAFSVQSQSKIIDYIFKCAMGQNLKRKISEREMQRFEDMVAIVVGGADNIGRATAVMLAEGGAHVVIGYHANASGAQEGMAEIEAAGGQAIAVQVDHSREDSVTALIDLTVSTFGKINILVNNAAKIGGDFLKRDRDVASMDADYWDDVMVNNLRGPMLTCKHSIPHMIAAGGGAIVNTGSGVVFRGDSVRTAYSASKIGLHSLTMDIATTYGKQNIRCNLVSPGLTMTRSVTESLEQHHINALAAQNLVPFVGEPKDLANVTCFLASPAARYVTGQIIAVDGGLHVHQCVVGQL